ncbi:hypothetical protein HBZS_117470 [Helicobacter bizzozeronii CCUG 35545]|nr:hypothetical protein HBZS_117470 [Helicobacter bizzozeronii CCUG 35545]
MAKITTKSVGQSPQRAWHQSDLACPHARVKYARYPSHPPAFFK